MSEGKLIVKNAKGVIFDLDGTLVDSMNVWKEIDVSYLGKHGYDVPDDLHDEIEGMSFTETAAYFKKRFCLKETVDEIKDCWNQMAYEKQVQHHFFLIFIKMDARLPLQAAIHAN